MGGSSLAPDVLHRTFGTQEGYLDLRVLDSTDPAAVGAVFDDLDPLKTLVIIASKSGTTTEPNAFLAYCLGPRPQGARQGRATTSTRRPARSSSRSPTRARASRPSRTTTTFREIFLNPPDIGGRYSALTYVGLVPASLIGLDLDALLASAIAMLGACREPDPARNPGVSLGIAMGTLAKAGRDKLTFLADDEIASFGAWVEQLIAESTGKHGVGIVPVDLEPLGAPSAYGTRPRLRPPVARRAARTAAATRWRTRSQAAGHPVIRIELGRPDRPRRRVRPLGGRDGDRRGGPAASTRSTSPTSRRPSS